MFYLVNSPDAEGRRAIDEMIESGLRFAVLPAETPLDELVAIEKAGYTVIARLCCRPDVEWGLNHPVLYCGCVSQATSPPNSNASYVPIRNFWRCL